MRTLKIIRTVIIIALALNLAITTLTDAFTHPELTQTQLAIRVPQTFFYNFSK